MTSDNTTIVTIQRPEAANSVASAGLRPAPLLSDETTVQFGFIDGADTVSVTRRTVPQGPVITERDLFRALADWWHEATDQLPPPRRAEHSAYQRIRALGRPMLPFVLEDLRDRGGDWYRLLKVIAAPDYPVPAEQDGNRAQMRDAWLDWGRREGHIV